MLSKTLRITLAAAACLPLALSDTSLSAQTTPPAPLAADGLRCDPPS